MPLYCAYIYVHFSTAAPLCHHMINLHDVRPTALQWLSSNTEMLQVVKNWKAEEKNCKASYSYSTAGGSEEFYLEILIGVTFLDEWAAACFLRPSARRCLDILQIQGIRVSLCFKVNYVNWPCKGIILELLEWDGKSSYLQSQSLWV